MLTPLIHLGYLAYDEQALRAAIEQIKQRDYPAVLRAWHGDIVLVGVSYDEKTGLHEAKIGRMR